MEDIKNIVIRKAIQRDANSLSQLAIQTFIESHGHSASKNDISSYVQDHLSTDQIAQELENKNNIFHLIFLNGILAGYSKIMLDQPSAETEQKKIAKLERLYILQSCYGKALGYKLFAHNMTLSKKEAQLGIWLHVWTENDRAINFYKKLGFDIVDFTFFKISDNHKNPNHKMLLLF